MAISKLKKIRLIAISKHKGKILETLQNSATIEIISTEENRKISTTDKSSIKKHQKAELMQANLEFCINMLSPYEKKSFLKGPIEISLDEISEIIENFDYKKTIKDIKKYSDEIVKAGNQINSLKTEIQGYTPWENLDLHMEDLSGTKETIVFIGSLKAIAYEEYKTNLQEFEALYDFKEISRDQTDINIRIICNKKIEADIKKLLTEFRFQEAEMPATEKGSLKNIIQERKKDLKESIRNEKTKRKNLQKIAPHLDKLKIAYDYYSWEVEKREVIKELGETEYSFLTQFWIPASLIEKIEKKLSKTTDEYLLEEIPLDEGEIPPVIIKNPKFLTPFEAVTRTYGLPLHNELDPTPFLSAFFILFFALCLTDAGYGIVMFVTMWAMQRFMKLGESIKKLVRLLMYGGVATFVIGAIFGGWFGLSPDQVPEFLTYTSENGEKLFIFQRINTLTQPLNVLIMSLSLGFIQILLGVYMRFFHTYINESKKDALLDTAPWCFLLTGIGFFIIIKAGVLPPYLETLGTIWLWTGVILIVLTQGREKNGIIGKLLSGILSLYGLVGYMSDVLSYSRLLALGLATAIIGMAVNVIAVLMKDMIPYVGWIFMILILLGGHILNLLINALGSFIHSGRLQFVEFFSKFMEGGGRDFQTFGKKCKYVYLSEKK